ncbi:SDR family NAD(P)-dependent oxidoreductase [Dickeya dadantii]|uniref:oxidoreductase n=1 Tax=Dickeya dadantii TaxID=204038 RepID=UPI001495CEF9|nr:oxidoreductase [Dickeya dadantii]NPE51190.1 SDR family NAD(P)-dependent oxidoreductase [Dickeya dadantii]
MTNTGFTETDVPDQSGKCFVVTGANTGIGFETSRVLAAHGARVIMACRSRDKADEAMRRIKLLTPQAELVFLHYDQGDLDSIRTATGLLAKEPRIDALINNAGVMTPPLMRTKQGFELQFGVNHLGCFALTALLLPTLSKTEGARIVVTSSIAHRGAHIDWDDLNAEKRYDRVKRYAASKLANALFFFELDRRLRASGSAVMVEGCHPGSAATDLGRYMGPLQILLPLVRVFLNSAAKGAWPTLQAATGKVIPGGYYGPIGFAGIRGKSGESSRTEQAQDPELARRLWDISVAMTGIDPDLPPATEK